MKKYLAVSGLVLSMATLSFSAGAFADMVVDPVTGFVQGTVNVFSNASGQVLGLVPVVNSSSVEYAAPGETPTVRQGILNNNQYIVQQVNNRPVITDESTGNSYWVTGVKQGTMDVEDSNGMTRYQYETYIVNPI